MAVAVAALLGASFATPTFAKDKDHHDNGWHNGRHYDDRYEYRRGPRYDYRYRDPYYYSAPVYVPPPVYYPPQPSPGFSFFFPLDLRR